MPIKEKFYIREGLVVNGDTIITGSVTTSVGFTGSLEGTASYSTTAQSVVGIVTSSSYATTASYATQALSASYAPSAGGSGTVNSGTANKLTYYASTGTAVSEASLLEYNGSNLVLTSTSQLEFYTNAGSIYFGNFSSPSYGRVGFSVPGQSVMVVDYSNVRAGFGGGTSLITSAPGGLVEIQGKADEIQLLVKSNSSQTNDIAQFKNSSGATTVKVDSAGTLVSTLQVLPTSSPTSPVNGSVYWDGNSATLFIYDGSNWKSVQLM